MELVFQIKIKKIGKNRLVLYIPKSFRETCKLKIGDIIKLKIEKGKKKASSISKFHYLITVRREIISLLGLKEGDKVRVHFRQAFPLEKPLNFMNKGKIDLLFFVPNKTKKGSEIFVGDQKEKKYEDYLRLCSFHSRGSASQIKIRRFVNPNLLGRFFGQLQAEGTKTFFDGIEFSNKSLHEHKDFISFLRYLGISSNKIFTKLDYHPSIKNIEEEIKKFQKFLGYKINYISSSSKSKGGFGFKIIVRNTVFSEIIHNAVNILREILVRRKWDSNLNAFADGFFSKLLNGDGSIDVIYKNRNIPQARLIISDKNLAYLEDYKLIMKKYGFTPHINRKWKYVRSYCSPKLIKKLLSIGAFENNPNREKLKFLINSRKKSPSK